MTRRTSGWRVLIATALVVSAAWRADAQGRPAGAFTIEQIMSSPFPSALVAAPTGSRVAWVSYAKGVRNVWVADGPTFKPRQVTAYAADDGQEITGLVWTPDAKHVVYVRGQGLNRAGESPNPSSDPAGAEQAVWIVSADGGAPQRLGAGTGAAVSPKGDRVAFVNHGQIWATGLGADDKAAQLAHVRGSARALRWSPDGASLAFVSARGNHSLVGVLDVAAKRVQFLAPSADFDQDASWSPDGKRIAFVRVPYSSDRIPFHPEREGYPWSIVVADVATGRGTVVWRAEPGPGSVFQPVDLAQQQLVWADDRLVFPWERTGWKLLYAVPAGGGQAAVLTPGRFEVEDVVLAPDGRSLIVVSNQDDTERRHLWRVPLAGGAPVALTRGAGIEWNPAPLGDGSGIVLLRSDARTPAHPAVLKDSQTRPLVADGLPPDFPINALVEPTPVTFTASDGMSIPAQLFLPRSARTSPARKHPAVIFFHGGSRRQMVLGWHYSSYYHNAYAFNQYLASRGYVVLSVNYRSGIGYGLEFREALNYGATGASEFADVVGAGLYLKARPEVDPAKIGLWGGSYGGYLTALGLSRASHLFSAGVDIHGVHDWNTVIQNFQPEYDPLAAPDQARLARDSSPMASVDGWRSPVLLIHGDDDRNVPFGETVTLLEALRARHVEVEQLIFPDEVHSFLRHARWLDAFTAAASFLERKLGTGPTDGSR